jgi:CheY-like chemotaxis protein/anti-sigma regulatory factor (Ser/Thr protein kinase)
MLPIRILIVDDDPLNRFLLTHMLEQEGYTDTYEAEDGLMALEMQERLDPDLVLLDVIMPDMDGYEVATRLKKRAGGIYLPIIFITALDDKDALVRCLSVGGDDFVAKPFNKVILAAKIRAHGRSRLLSKETYTQNKLLSYHRNLVEREHKIVEHIFSNALSIDDSLRPFIDYQLTPATDFNGDLFLMCKNPGGGMYFLIGDFTGHGLASAIGALPVAQAFQTMCGKGLSLVEMARTLNKTLLLFLPDDMFFAAALVEIKQNGTQIDVWNGGMPELILQSKEGPIVKRFFSKHMSLGILDDQDFEAEVDRYEARYGDRLIGFSDGILEIENPQGEMLGEDGIEQWLIQQPEIDLDTMLLKVSDYTQGAERLDDITLVIYICQPLTSIERLIHASNVPTTIINKLNVVSLKTENPIVKVVDVLTNQLNLYGLHSEIFTVLSELYNNSLDHGILVLDSEVKHTEDGFFEYFTLREERLQALTEGSITITTDYNPQNKQLHIQLKDSGKGFDPTQIEHNSHSENSYGRGIALVKELADSLEYSENGTKVDVLFNI